MTGKKKSMDGGMIGMITKNYSKEKINNIASKIIKGKYNQNSTWLDRKLNNQRAEQRINAFFKKLSEELKILSTTSDDSKTTKLYNYFKDIVKKYPDEIDKILRKEIISGTNSNGKYSGDFLTAYNYFKNKKLDTKFYDIETIFKKFKKKSQVPVYIRENLNSQTVSDASPQPRLLVVNNTQNLIREYEQFKQNLMPDKNRGIRQINNTEKQKLSNYIINLATRIYETALKTQDSDKFIYLKNMLHDLREKYLYIFIESHKQNNMQLINNIQGVNEEKSVYNNLGRKYEELNRFKPQNIPGPAFLSKEIKFNKKF
jgi:hypothetical protein